MPGLVLVEWPERAGEALGRADLRVSLDLEGTGRRISVVPGSDGGRAWLAACRPLLED
jgi:tRNA threonylcarbamoyladenosine biosynthesis protein TsaE